MKGVGYIIFFLAIVYLFLLEFSGNGWVKRLVLELKLPDIENPMDALVEELRSSMRWASSSRQPTGKKTKKDRDGDGYDDIIDPYPDGEDMT